MGFRDLFRIAVAPPRPPVLPGQPLAAAGTLPPRQVDAFVTPEALLSFSGMTAAITLLWGFIEAIGGLPHLLWVGRSSPGSAAFCSISTMRLTHSAPRRQRGQCVFSPL
jgi:hypothetical protein